jgi:protoporphyrinogen oxidase
MSRDSDQGLTVVVGAGLAGLVAANEWLDAGERVVLLERDAETGGMAKSVQHNGFTFDLGPHFILRHTDWQSCLFEPHELVEFSSRIHFQIDQRWIEYPFGIKSLLQVPLRVGFDALLTQAIGRNPFNGNTSESLPPESFSDRMASQWGHGILEWMFRPYLEHKMDGVDMIDSLHQDWWSGTEHVRGVAIRTDSVEEKRTILRRMSEGLSTIIEYTARANTIQYPRGGFGEFAQRLTIRFLERGGELQLGTPIAEIEKDNQRINAVVTPAGDRIPVKRLIWTGSPTDLADLLGVAPIGLPTLHSMVYFVEFDKRYPRRGNEVRLVDEDMAFFRGYFPETICDGLAPPDQSGLVAEAGTLDEKVAMNAESRYGDVIDTCVRIGLCPAPSAVTSVTHRVVRDAYPIYPLDYEHHLSSFYERLAPLGNLILSGRSARFHYINVASVMEQGTRTLEDTLF